jgi:hypothetical protein
MAKSAWQGTYDPESHVLPKSNRRLVGGNDKIELHAPEPKSTRLA